VQITLALYSHKHWQKIIEFDETRTCQDKMDLAFMITNAHIPLSGEKTAGHITLSERNMYRPVMYYLAAMDCNDAIYHAFGDERYGRVSLRTELTANH